MKKLIIYIKRALNMYSRRALMLIVSLLFVTAMMGQSIKVQGTVTDETGEAVIGASVVVKGNPTKGTVTDYNGKFTLDGVDKKSTLEVSYVGMTKKEVKAANTVNVVMQEDTHMTQEVLVVAFGEQKKSSFTGSAKVVGSEEIGKLQVTTVTDALAGKVAGVQVSSSGSPGSSGTLRVRGFSSLNSGNDPLIVLDGVPYDGYLNTINPSDIESMTVLKDASSNALYGARGANGVIMITTKKASRGDATITLDAKWGSNSRANQKYEYITSPAQYYEMHYAALYNKYLSDGQSAILAHQNANSTMGLNASQGGLGYLAYSVPNGEYLIGDNGKLNPHATLGNRVQGVDGVYTITPDNWWDEAYKNSLRQEYNLNINGGNDKAQYYGSLGYMNQDGIVDGSGFERYSARLKSSYQVRPWLKLSGNVNYVHYILDGVTEDGTSDIFSVISQVAPIYPVYLRDENGNIMRDQNGKMYDYGDAANNGLTRPVQTQTNPLGENKLNTAQSVGNTLTLNGAFDITPFDGFKITINGSVYNDEYRYTGTTQPFYGWTTQTYPGGYVSKYHSRITTFNFQQLLNYSKDFGDHSLALLLGHESYKMTTDGLSAGKTNMFSFFNNRELDGAITTVNSSVSSNESNYNTEGYFGRAMYDYQDTYFANLSYRRDASSRFHPKHRWGNFYSIGGAWIMTKEEWADYLTKRGINELKVKASFGQQGNDQIGDFRYTDTYNIENTNDNVALTLASVGNPKITWETNNNINLGVEFELFHGKISGSLDYFYRKTTDMLCRVYVPKSMGYTSYWDNIGDMLNSGIEFDIQATPISKGGFNWDVNFNLTHYDNKITMLYEDNKNTVIDGHGGYTSGSYFYGEDLPLYEWYLRKYAGVNESGQAQWYYTDDNGKLQKTTTYSEGDYYLCGTPIPDLYGGFGTTLSYKGFDLSVNFGYSIGGKAYDGGYASAMSMPYAGSTGKNFHKDLLNAWSTSNTTSDIPRLQYGDMTAASESDRFLTDASWLNLQSINLGYTIPVKFVKRIGLGSVRVYAACDNVYFWSKRKGFDPRVSYSGSVSGNTYSPIRTITGGIKVQF